MGFKAIKPSCGTLISRLLVVVLPQYSTIPTFQYSGLSAPQTSPLRGASKPAPVGSELLLLFGAIIGTHIAQRTSSTS